MKLDTIKYSADHAAPLPAVKVVDVQTRRFFRGLETRDSKVHLARVAALDSCACQVLTRTLARAPVEPSDGSLAVLLSGIRADEARHVCTSRALARVLGLHFIQEDSPEEIGVELTDFVKRLC